MTAGPSLSSMDIKQTYPPLQEDLSLQPQPPFNPDVACYSSPLSPPLRADQSWHESMVHIPLMQLSPYDCAQELPSSSSNSPATSPADDQDTVYASSTPSTSSSLPLPTTVRALQMDDPKKTANNFTQRFKRQATMLRRDLSHQTKQAVESFKTDVWLLDFSNNGQSSETFSGDSLRSIDPSRSTRLRSLPTRTDIDTGAANTVESQAGDLERTSSKNRRLLEITLGLTRELITLPMRILLHARMLIQVAGSVARIVAESRSKHDGRTEDDTPIEYITPAPLEWQHQPAQLSQEQQLLLHSTLPTAPPLDQRPRQYLPPNKDTGEDAMLQSSMPGTFVGSLQASSSSSIALMVPSAPPMPILTSASADEEPFVDDASAPPPPYEATATPS
ncbi:hypothetical protein BGZ68_003366 [Mortierella alpina]|nr:hypothetical protein BGZ68_003366 [Mortierella alpina]